MKLELNLLKNNTCPECGARWVEAGVATNSSGEVARHVNGGEWQYVKYLCGRTDKYIPNFESVRTERPCSKNAAVVADRERKAKAKQKLTQVLRELDLTESERQSINLTCLT